MSTQAREVTLLQATIGKKAVMAATGVILFGYVVGHLLGNLQVFAGAARINAYAAFLHRTKALLWGTRVILAVSVVLHTVYGVELYFRKRAARPVGYSMWRPVEATLSSRTMLWSGVATAAFVTFHLLQLTFGTILPGFSRDDVYGNLVRGFSVVQSSAAYILALVALAMHLRHGLWSVWQTAGVNHPRYTPGFQRFALAAAAVILVGFVSIPVAVLAGLIK